MFDIFFKGWILYVFAQFPLSTALLLINHSSGLLFFIKNISSLKYINFSERSFILYRTASIERILNVGKNSSTP